MTVTNTLLKQHLEQRSTSTLSCSLTGITSQDAGAPCGPARSVSQRHSAVAYGVEQLLVQGLVSRRSGVQEVDVVGGEAGVVALPLQAGLLDLEGTWRQTAGGVNPPPPANETDLRTLTYGH